ncbi:ATP-binding protein [Nonomuraea sp. NPDC052265]|uniref:ATP-binding protein n=1 Tax=Nonomuraea sp. NPDC052265 TaxID=3364374 RepID=UPI0037C762F3
MAMEPELRRPISTDLDAIRRLVREHAGRGGLSGERLDNFVLAVNEAVTNVLDHGGGTGTVVARNDAGGVTVEIADDAGWLSAAHLAAAEHGRAHSAGFGFGLWLIQHLCDHVELDQSPQGSRLRLQMSVRTTPDPQPALLVPDDPQPALLVADDQPSGTLVPDGPQPGPLVSHASDPAEAALPPPNLPGPDPAGFPGTLG